MAGDADKYTTMPWTGRTTENDWGQNVNSGHAENLALAEQDTGVY